MGTRLTRTGVAIALLIASLLLLDRCFDSRVSEWEKRAQAAETLSETLQARVDTLRAEADSLRSQAVTVVERVVVERAPVTDSMVASLPPAVTAGEHQRDTAIVRLTGERDDALAAFARLQGAYDRLEGALDDAVERGDSLHAVLEDRPGRRPWFIPEITVGASAVLDDGRVEIKYPSVNVGWRIGL